jgi:hypothetical protein
MRQSHSLHRTHVHYGYIVNRNVTTYIVNNILILLPEDSHKHQGTDVCAKYY